MSDFIMQIGADLDLSKVQEQFNSIKNQKVTLDVEIKCGKSIVPFRIPNFNKSCKFPSITAAFTVSGVA